MNTPLKSDPLWFKDAIIYEVPVRGFYDSNGDGIGDFQGLIQKLDYLEDLGINTIWLLPFYPSPQKDDGFDVTDHCDVHPDYGTVADFKQFLKEAHRRGLRVLTELILNHTSDQHPWFKRSRRQKRDLVIAIFMYGAIVRKNIRRRALSFLRRSQRTGHGMQMPALITGIGSFAISLS